MSTDPAPELLVRKIGQGAWHPPSASSFTQEAGLRDLLGAEPSLLPGLAASAAAVTEFPVAGVGSVDVLAVDAEGSLAIVECKLASNPEIRRQVVGQVMAYAAGLWQTTVADFERSWQSRAAGRSVIDAVLGESHEESDAAALREALDGALADGRFSLILAVDSITPELRRIVEYLNGHTLAEVSVLALELTYSREADLEILIPKVFGAELASVQTRPRARREWTESDVLAALDKHGAKAVEVGRRLMDHYKADAQPLYFGTGARPSVTPTLMVPGGPCQPWSLYAYESPVVAANFEYTKALPDDVRRQFVYGVAAIPGAGVNADEILAADLQRRPSIPIVGVLDQAGTLDAFIAAVDRLIGRH